MLILNIEACFDPGEVKIRGRTLAVFRLTVTSYKCVLKCVLLCSWAGRCSSLRTPSYQLCQQCLSLRNNSWVCLCCSHESSQCCVWVRCSTCALPFSTFLNLFSSGRLLTSNCLSARYESVASYHPVETSSCKQKIWLLGYDLKTNTSNMFAWFILWSNRSKITEKIQ